MYFFLCSSHCFLSLKCFGNVALGSQGGIFFFFLVSPKILGLVFLSMFAKQNSESYLSTVFVLKLKTFAHYMLNFYYFPGVGAIIGSRFLPATHDQHGKQAMEQIKLGCVCLGNAFGFQWVTFADIWDFALKLTRGIKPTLTFS